MTFPIVLALGGLQPATVEVWLYARVQNLELAEAAALGAIETAISLGLTYLYLRYEARQVATRERQDAAGAATTVRQRSIASRPAPTRARRLRHRRSRRLRRPTGEYGRRERNRTGRPVHPRLLPIPPVPADLLGHRDDQTAPGHRQLAPLRRRNPATRTADGESSSLSSPIVTSREVVVPRPSSRPRLPSAVSSSASASSRRSCSGRLSSTTGSPYSAR